MLVNGCDCSIAIKTTHLEMAIPYSSETIRQAVTLLQEEAAIEGDGVCRGLRKVTGATGCIVTPLTIGTAPLLLCLAMGSSESPVFISETRDLYRCQLDLLPVEDTEQFDLIQDRGREQIIFTKCEVKGFELRINRGEAIKLKLDVFGDGIPSIYPHAEQAEVTSNNERFNGDYVSYKLNGNEYKNIYGLTLSVNKENGTKTQLLIKRVLKQGSDLPEFIQEMTITARLLRDKYEFGHCGTFRITLFRLFLISDETEVEAADTVMGPVRYYAAGGVTIDVFTNDNGDLI
jgi:hypothetical protein